MSPRPVRLGEPACGDWVRSETPLPWRRPRGADAVGPPLRRTPDALLHWGSGGVPAGPRTEFTVCEPSRGGRQAPIQAPRTWASQPSRLQGGLGGCGQQPQGTEGLGASRAGGVPEAHAPRTADSPAAGLCPTPADKGSLVSSVPPSAPRPGPPAVAGSLQPHVAFQGLLRVAPTPSLKPQEALKPLVARDQKRSVPLEGSGTAGPRGRRRRSQRLCSGVTCGWSSGGRWAKCHRRRGLQGDVRGGSTLVTWPRSSWDKQKRSVPLCCGSLCAVRAPGSQTRASTQGAGRPCWASDGLGPRATRPGAS